MRRSTGVSWQGAVAGAVAGGFLCAVLAASAVAADVTAQRLANPRSEPENWLQHAKNYEAHRHSELRQITTSNVRNLKVAFTAAIGGVGGAGRYNNAVLEATPLVEDGMMYLPNGWGDVYKIDVSKGDRAEFVWIMDPGTDKAWSADVACCGVDNRGVGLWNDKVISVTLDGRLIATNATTGEIEWERTVADPGIAETLTVAPLIVKDLAIVGPAGAEYGIRGWIDATNLNTGKQAWRTHTIPGEGEPGNETWTDDYNAWDTGGGSIWVTGTADLDLNHTYWGTGNPGPDWDAEYRPGDNLYTDSVLALNIDTGAIEWYFQYTPNDPYDYDEIGEHQILDVEIGGQPRKALIHAGRNGFIYAFDRTNGQFLYAEQYVDIVNWTDGIDPKTGLPTNYDPNTQVQAYKPGAAPRRDGTIGTQCPLIGGGKNWEPAALNPNLGLMYVPGGEGCQQRETVVQEHPVRKGGTVKARDRFVGGKGPADPAATDFPLREAGSLKAIDVKTGRTVARLDLPHFNRSGALSTASGLVFTGEYNGVFHAMDGRTLRELWTFNTGTAIKAPPISYAINGKQYIAVLVGSDVRSGARRANPMLEMFSPAHMLYVFTL